MRASMNVHYRTGGGEPGYIAPDWRGLDPNVLYTSSNRLWRTTDGGDSWERLSDDLTRADPMTLGHSGGPITGDMNGPEVAQPADEIPAVGPGKVDIDVIWTGSDDVLVHVTRDGGESWKSVTPPDMPDFGRVSLIDASAFDAGKAYVSGRLPLLDDFRPQVWRTEDYGETWTRIVHGIREDAYVNSVREDPDREGLLYAGKNHGVYVTFDDGGWWQELNPGPPDIRVTDVIPEHDELAMASHGRGFWVLERIRVLPTREGDGPHEFSQGHSGMTMGPGGRLPVSRLLRVIEYDSTGRARQFLDADEQVGVQSRGPAGDSRAE